MEFKGTKGVWDYVYEENEFEVFSEPKNTGDFKSICNNINNEYDALLISKAPEMLEMLQEVHKYQVHADANDERLRGQVWKLINQAAEL